MALKPPIAHFYGVASSITASTEVEITGAPPRGYITRIHVKTTGGTGSSNLQPVLGNATDPAGKINQILQVAASSGLHIDEVPTQRIPYKASDSGSLFLRFVPDASPSSLNVAWELFIEPGF